MHVRPQDLQAMQRQRLKAPRHQMTTGERTLRDRFASKLRRNQN